MQYWIFKMFFGIKFRFDLPWEHWHIFNKPHANAFIHITFIILQQHLQLSVGKHWNRWYHSFAIFKFDFLIFCNFYFTIANFYPLICTCMSEYQRVRNVSFTENFAYVLNEWLLNRNIVKEGVIGEVLSKSFI